MELLPDWMQLTFALALWGGAMFGVAYGVWWGVGRVRKYRDVKQSTFDD